MARAFKVVRETDYDAFQWNFIGQIRRILEALGVLSSGQRRTAEHLEAAAQNADTVNQPSSNDTTPGAVRAMGHERSMSRWSN